MVVLLKTTSVRVSSIQIMHVRVQNKGKSVWKSRYDGDVSATSRVVPIACSPAPKSVAPTAPAKPLLLGLKRNYVGISPEREG